MLNTVASTGSTVPVKALDQLGLVDAPDKCDALAKV